MLCKFMVVIAVNYLHMQKIHFQTHTEGMLMDVSKLERNETIMLSIQASLQVDILQVTKANSFILVMPLCSMLLTRQFTLLLLFQCHGL